MWLCQYWQYLCLLFKPCKPPISVCSVLTPLHYSPFTIAIKEFWGQKISIKNNCIILLGVFEIVTKIFCITEVHILDGAKSMTDAKCVDLHRTDNKSLTRRACHNFRAPMHSNSKWLCTLMCLFIFLNSPENVRCSKFD